MKLLKNKRLLAIISLILLIIILILILIMKNRVYANVYYRVYTKEKGWSSWCENGKTCGTSYSIKAIEIKVKSNSAGDIFYNVKTKDGWMDNDSYSSMTAGNKKDNINDIKMMLSRTLYRKYNVLYRVKTNDKWSNWQSNYETRENENEDINQIEIKLE